MIKRVNFTGRRRIPLDRVTIEVHDGKPRRFDANIDLNDLGLLPHAAVVLEAMCAGNSTVSRFDFGTVESIAPPSERLLHDLNGEHVFFNLKVIDRTERFGRILGIAENVRAAKGGDQTAVGRRGILPIERVELGQQLWRLEYREHDVFLLVNRNVSDLAVRAGSDPLFYAVVYPQIIRDILTRSLFHETPDVEADDDRWFNLWARFGMQLHPLHLRPPNGDEEESEAREWIEEVVKAFCTNHTLRDRFTTAASNSNGGVP